MRMGWGIALMVCLGGFNKGTAQHTPLTFAPPDTPMSIQAVEIQGTLTIDGNLDEPQWQRAIVVNGFVQQNPDQGKPASFGTEVRVLYNQQFLYIGAVCYDDFRQRQNLRVQNLSRDFNWNLNDNFGIAIDGFQDERNAASFQTTPLGNLRDLQVIDGGTSNTDWDALWYCRTQIADTAWYVEMAIPWKTLRYPEGAAEMGVVFIRNIRRNNEYAVLPAIPRVFTAYRMAYAAVLTGLRPPKPSANLQINPYLLYEAAQSKAGTGTVKQRGRPKVGGEVKWAISPSTVLDVTANTDFAQADVDQQVVNLERFSVLFPERRQFFLENANIFRANVTNFFMPFFSRRIGLDDAGNAIPLDGGLRLTSQTDRRSIGLLAMQQQASDSTPRSRFGLLRYAENLGEQSRLGGMLTYRHDAGMERNGQAVPANSNYTYTVDGIYRPSQSFTAHAMVSGSKDEAGGDGLAAQLWTGYSTNLLYIGWLGYYVRNYQPGMGLERFGRDYLYNSPAVRFDLRPGWLPKGLLSYQPGIYAGLFHTLDLRGIISGNLAFTPVDLVFRNSASVQYTLEQNWQGLTAEERFVGISVAPGNYAYWRHRVSVSSDLSAKLGGSASYGFGGYFDGQLQTWQASGRFAPSPKLEFSADYIFNDIQGLGPEAADLRTHLLGLNVRLALNPRLQFIGFGQYNTAAKLTVWNMRLSWEYRPLSFFYVVLNSNQLLHADPAARFAQQQGIAKATYLRQF